MRLASLFFCLAVTVASALVPGLYSISGNVSPWWFGGHLLIFSGEENGTAGSVLFAYDHDSDCIIPGCEWRSIYSAQVINSNWEFSKALTLRSPGLWLLPLAAWHFPKRWHCVVLPLAFVAIALASGNAASAAGSYEALISVVKHNPDMNIPHIGEARAEIEVLESGRMRGRMRTWFTTHSVNILLGGTVESAEAFGNQVPMFYQTFGHLYQDASGNNFSLPNDALLGYAIPGNLEHMYPTFDGGCHPQEENGPLIAYSVGEDFLVLVICLRYASGGLILKALQDNDLVSTLHTWRASSDCTTGPTGGTAAEDFPHVEYKLAPSCSPWDLGTPSPSACPQLAPVECAAVGFSWSCFAAVIVLALIW